MQRSDPHTAGNGRWCRAGYVWDRLGLGHKIPYNGKSELVEVELIDHSVHMLRHSTSSGQHPRFEMKNPSAEMARAEQTWLCSGGAESTYAEPQLLVDMSPSGSATEVMFG